MKARPYFERCRLGLFKPRWICWVLLTGDAAIVAGTSASRICAPAHSEQSLEQFEFLAVAIFAATAKAESGRPSGLFTDNCCREPRRNFNTSTPAGAAKCRIAGLQRCWASCFPFVIEASHMPRCVAIHSLSVADSICESQNRTNTTGLNQGANPLHRHKTLA